MPDDFFTAGQAGMAEPSPFPGVDDEAAAGGKDEANRAAARRPGDPVRLDLVMNIPVRLSVELGRAEIPIRDVVNVGRGSVIELDRNVGEPLDVRVNGVLIGHGEIVVIDEERLGLRFIDVVSRAERVSGLT
ncbi:MAG TPA: flagellar motor switch protein FliN [Stellaceae bacterium]|nr:flagellar motor switch protein FliN [Stellaceae bacterium]